MNPEAYKDKQSEPKAKAWACPCSGCAKAVKQERLRLSELIESLDIDQIDLKSTILDIINPPKSEAEKKR